jgi:hypothetical protein
MNFMVDRMKCVWSAVLLLFFIYWAGSSSLLFSFLFKVISFERKKKNNAQRKTYLTSSLYLRCCRDQLLTTPKHRSQRVITLPPWTWGSTGTTCKHQGLGNCFITTLLVQPFGTLSWFLLSEALGWKIRALPSTRKIINDHETVLNKEESRG